MPTERSPKPNRMRGIVQRLEGLQRAGVTHLPKVARPAATVVRSDVPPTPTGRGKTPIQPSHFAGPPGTPEPVADSLDAVRREVAACQRCPQLCTTRTQTVFGVGNLTPRLCFIGEAPGADEDEQGEPFVGRAGQLLTKIIEACQMRREDVYILNILKCRPPENRTPLPEEAANCREFLVRQLHLLRPEFICCLGTTAAQNLLGSELTIGRLRGKFHSYEGTPVLCTYHPSYLLRNPAAKRDVWEDMQLLMKRMGIQLS